MFTIHNHEALLLFDQIKTDEQDEKIITEEGHK